MTTADLVLTGGKILTLDRHSRIVQALAVRGGRIAALGRDIRDRGPHRSRHAPPGPPRPPRRARAHRRPCPHGPRGPQAPLAITRRRAVHRRYLADRRGRGAPHAAWRVDRDHAHRRAPDVRGRAGESRGESLADAPRPGPGRARPSRLHPRHLGALAQYPAPGLHRQYEGARARGHRARHAAARAVHRDRARRSRATRPASSSSRRTSRWSSTR